jgi:uncharacterized membrane protein HdeD (DUF308 family)
LFGLLTLIVGGYLVSQPLAGLASITLFLAAYFVATGILAIVASVQMKPADGWGWMLANGIVTLLLGAMIWRQWPVSGVWAVGVLFGVQLAMTGVALLTAGSAVRQVTAALKKRRRIAHATQVTIYEPPPPRAPTGRSAA